MYHARKNHKLDISIHSLRVEGDQNTMIKCQSLCHFNPLPPCGGRRMLLRQIVIWCSISIHSLRVEGDQDVVDAIVASVISIHSLRVEGDVFCPPIIVLIVLFQSTPSVWRETRASLTVSLNWRYFNPLPPCGGRHLRSIAQMSASQFQSTPSVWRETGGVPEGLSAVEISIHSLRVEGDEGIILEGLLESIFQSTPSVWRETCGTRAGMEDEFKFQSTPSVWRETTARLYR